MDIAEIIKQYVKDKEVATALTTLLKLGVLHDVEFSSEYPGLFIKEESHRGYLSFKLSNYVMPLIINKNAKLTETTKETKAEP